MSLLELKKAGFRYSPYDPWVFRDLDFTINAGSAVRVVGRNGSGKSTLLKVLSGNLRLTEGIILPSEPPCVYMDQSAGNMLSDGLTVAEQLRAAASHSIGDADTYLNRALSQFGLGLPERLGDFVGHLSGGQKQIVALLCVVAAGSKILCLDEFVSALDARSINAVEALLTHVQAEFDVSLILVSHSALRIGAIADFDISTHGDI